MCKTPWNKIKAECFWVFSLVHGLNMTPKKDYQIMTRRSCKNIVTELYHRTMIFTDCCEKQRHCKICISYLKYII